MRRVTLYMDCAQFHDKLQVPKSQQAFEWQVPSTTTPTSIFAIDTSDRRATKVRFVPPQTLQQLINSSATKKQGEVGKLPDRWTGTLLHASEEGKILIRSKQNSDLLLIPNPEYVLVQGLNAEFMEYSHVVLETSSVVTREIELTYGVSQLGWNACIDCILRKVVDKASPEEDVNYMMDLELIGQIFNNCGTELRDCTVELVAGSARKTSQGHNVVISSKRMMMPQSVAPGVSAAAFHDASGGEQENSGMRPQDDFQVFQTTTRNILENEIQMIPLYSVRARPTTKMYQHRLGSHHSQTEVLYSFETSHFVPNCTVQVFAESKDSQTGEFLGSDAITEKQASEKVEVVTGSSSLVRIKSTVKTENLNAMSKMTYQNDEFSQTVNGTIMNHSDKKVFVLLRHDFASYKIVKMDNLTVTIGDSKPVVVVPSQPAKNQLTWKFLIPKERQMIKFSCTLKLVRDYNYF